MSTARPSRQQVRRLLKQALVAASAMNLISPIWLGITVPTIVGLALAGLFTLLCVRRREPWLRLMTLLELLLPNRRATPSRTHDQAATEVALNAPTPLPCPGYSGGKPPIASSHPTDHLRAS